MEEGVGFLPQQQSRTIGSVWSIWSRFGCSSNNTLMSLFPPFVLLSLSSFMVTWFLEMLEQHQQKKRYLVRDQKQLGVRYIIEELSFCIKAFVTPFRFQSPPAVRWKREKVFNQDPKSEREIVCLFVYNMASGRQDDDNGGWCRWYVN